MNVENKYVPGDLVRVIGRFQDPVTGDYIEPSAVSCEVKDPDGNLTHPEATFRAELSSPDGITAPGYFAEIDVQTPGPWYYRFAATGSGQGASEGTFYVEHSAFAE